MPRWLVCFLTLPPGAVFASGLLGALWVLLDHEIPGAWLLVAFGFFGPLVAWVIGHLWAQRLGLTIQPRWGGDE